MPPDKMSREKCHRTKCHTDKMLHGQKTTRTKCHRTKRHTDNMSEDKMPRGKMLPDEMPHGRNATRTQCHKDKMSQKGERFVKVRRVLVTPLFVAVLLIILTSYKGLTCSLVIMLVRNSFLKFGEFSVFEILVLRC